jgi:hypothetical protein
VSLCKIGYWDLYVAYIWVDWARWSSVLGAFTGYACMGGVWGLDDGWISLMSLAGRKGPGLHHCIAYTGSPPFLNGEPTDTKSVLIYF